MSILDLLMKIFPQIQKRIDDAVNEAQRQERLAADARVADALRQERDLAYDLIEKRVADDKKLVKDFVERMSTVGCLNRDRCDIYAVQVQIHYPLVAGAHGQEMMMIAEELGRRVRNEVANTRFAKLTHPFSSWR
jgi:hypothetical protein